MVQKRRWAAPFVARLHENRGEKYSHLGEFKESSSNYWSCRVEIEYRTRHKLLILNFDGAGRPTGHIAVSGHDPNRISIYEQTEHTTGSNNNDDVQKHYKWREAASYDTHDQAFAEFFPEYARILHAEHQALLEKRQRELEKQAKVEQKAVPAGNNAASTHASTTGETSKSFGALWIVLSLVALLLVIGLIVG